RTTSTRWFSGRPSGSDAHAADGQPARAVICCRIRTGFVRYAGQNGTSILIPRDDGERDDHRLDHGTTAAAELALGEPPAPADVRTDRRGVPVGAGARVLEPAAAGRGHHTHGRGCEGLAPGLRPAGAETRSGHHHRLANLPPAGRGL